MCLVNALAMNDLRERHSARSGIARHLRDETAPRSGAIRGEKSTGVIWACNPEPNLGSRGAGG